MQDPTSVADALADHAISLDTAGPDPGPDTDRSDLAPVADAVGDATVIGLGEATHGTREFFQLKDRLVRYLVAEEDLRLVGMEANFAETMAIDRYITDGEGTVLDALENIYFWTWDTEEVVAMLDWLRDFNDGRSRDDQVRFWGYDMQYTTGATAALQKYLETHDPEALQVHGDTLELLQERDLRMDGDGDRVRRLDTARDMVSALRARLDEHEQASVDTGDHRTLGLARQYLRTIEDATAAVRADENDDTGAIMRIRDTSMAENVTWILDQSPHDRIVLWAHNEHVRRGTMAGDWGEVRTMGDHLAERYGDEYFTLGFDFACGELQGKVGRADADDAPDHELGVCEYGDPESDTLTATLAEVDHPLFFLDVQTASEETALKAVLGSDARIRSVGAYVGNESEHWASIVPADVYDGLIFVQETTRAVPNDRAR